MKLAVWILLPFMALSSWVYSQKWKDSLMSARNQYKEGKYAEAFKTYQHVKKIAPKKVDLTAEMAQAAYKSQQYEAAEKMYNQSGGKYAPSIQKAKTYHNLGNSKLKQKKYDEAIQAYRESLRNNPADEETRYNLAKAMKTQKNEQKKQQQQPPPQKPQAPSPNKNQPPKQEKQDQAQQSSKLNDKKTDRMLDELMKKEMDTKKKMDQQRGQTNTSNSGIDW